MTECAYELELLQVSLPQLTEAGSMSGKERVLSDESVYLKSAAWENGGRRKESAAFEESILCGESAEYVAGRDSMGIPALRFEQAKRLIAKERGRESAECHDFEPEEERLLSEIAKRKWSSDFVFVTHYPEPKRPFYVMEEPENPKETLSFDLIFRGLEITTGGQRIHDYNMQLEKLRRRGMDSGAFEGFLMMHKHGMPPHGGLGIGLERLTARILGFENLRQACLFPRDIHRLEP